MKHFESGAAVAVRKPVFCGYSAGSEGSAAQVDVCVVCQEVMDAKDDIRVSGAQSEGADAFFSRNEAGRDSWTCVFTQLITIPNCRLKWMNDGYKGQLRPCAVVANDTYETFCGSSRYTPRVDRRRILCRILLESMGTEWH